MADNLIFPIGFDLEKGVKDVISRSDTYLRQIEHAMTRKPIVLRAEVDASKFQMFSRQFTNSIDGISAKLAQAQRLWNAMTFDVKFDADGNLSRRAQVVFDAFQQLTQASATMGQRLGEVNRNLAKSEQDTARAITAEYDKRRQQVNEQIRLKERQAAAEERVRQGQLKGVNAGYVDTQRQVEAVRNLRLQYEAILPMLNAMAQRRYDIKVGIDKQFEADIQRINAEIARLRQSNLQLGTKGDTNAIQANLQAIRQLEAELQRISKQKIDLLNSNKINSDLARLRTEISSVFGELQSAERRLATDNSLNAALDAQSQKVLKLHADIQKLDQQFAQLNATGRAYNQDGSFTAQANTLLQQRIALTKQLEQEAITGQQAQIKLEQQLREEKRQTEQAAKNAAKEAERQAKAEAAARKQAQDAANAENKARQEAYNARRRQGQETQRILNKEAKSIADITAKLQIQQQRLQSANIGSAKFNKIAEEVKRLTADLEKANQKMRELTGQTQSGAARQSAAVKQVSQEFKNQETYVSRLIKRMAVYASFSAFGNFLTNVREVTAQFELQRISLGAVIQDQARANQLFEEIKTFALKSPVKILDLTKYTKQLAAYKIGVDELFDTTKRLTDISVGLGVSMDRIVLMYGQIRATGYLRASEVRQATEAGIPLVEELANKLSKANGELVRASDVMEMISKREIPFEMVKEVFEDMTSAGGMFYNMQEKQGNTLFGMWQKLGDAAAVMYDQIGNTSSVNEGMKMAIQTLRYLMLHWKQVGIVVGGVSVYILANTIATKNNAIATAAATTANKLHIASLQQKLGALRLEQMNLKSTHISQRLYTAATISATKAQIGAATSTNVFSKALYGLKAALLSNPLTALAVALTTIIALLMQSESELDKLNSKLQDIDRDYDASGKKSVDRFKELVKAVEENVDGSKAQKEALDELDRTYGKILGSEALELDSLKALGGQYGELIDMIDAYNAKKRGEEKETAIRSSYATILDEEKDDLMDYLNQAGMSAEKQAEFISRLNEKLIEYSGQADAAIRATDETFREFADDISQLDAAGNILNVLNFDKLADAWGVGFRQIGGWFGGQGMDYLYNYARAMEGQNKALEDNEIATRNAVRGLDEYAEGMNNLAKAINIGENAILDWSSMEALYNSLQDYNSKHPENMISVPIDLSFDPAKAETEYDKMLETSNMRIHAIFSNLQSIASQEGVSIPEEFYKQAKSVVEGNKDFSFIDFDGLSKLFTTDKAKNALKESKQLYESIAPSDDTIRMFNRKFITLADNMDVSLDKMQEYLMKSGDNLGEHREKLSDEITNLLKDIARLEWTKKALSLFGLPTAAVEAELQKQQQTVKLLQSMISTIPDIEGIGKKKKGSKGSKSDNRLQNLQEIEQTLTKINQKYDELAKKEGQTKALEDINNLYANTLQYINKLGKQFKLSFKMPTEFKDLQDYRKAILDVINTLKMKGYQKAALDLEEKIGTGNLDALQKDIEKQLKELSDRISRTKTAKEFYEKILSTTGDYSLASKVAESIFGQNGAALQKALADQVRGMTNGIELPDGIISAGNIINYKALRQFAEANRDELGKMYDELIKISNDGQKDLAKTYEGYLKDLEKAKTYADKRVELARTTAAKIREIESNPQYTKEQKAELKRGYQEREDREAAKLEYEAFKDTPLYVQMFEDLEHASTSTLEMMKSRLEALSGVWGTALDPTQLKEIQSRMNEIDSQLRERNPFKTLKKSYQQYRDAVKSVSLQGAVENAGAAAKEHYDMAVDYGADSAQARAAEKELKAREKIVEIARKVTAENKKGAKALDEAARIANDNLKIARGHLELAAAEEQALRDKSTYENPDQDPKVIAAHEAVEAAKEEVNLAERVAEITTNNAKTAKTLKESFASAANQVTQYMSMAGDLAHAVADTMEALGGDEEDVQFWNDIGDAIGDLTAGFQGLIDSILSLNVAGVISNAIGVIPNMVKGFVGLFSAGKVRRANKEIKRQQELLEQLEYTYGRLEKAADKAFGRDYVNNYNQQLKNLQAQQKAYLKQAEAERSKGKKKDKEKIKEYEEAARETADKIKELQNDLVAHFTGSSKTDVARQMAKSWIDARASMSDTFAAIKGDYADMIKNMIVEGAAARVIENALTPVWDSMQKMLDKNDVQGAIDSLINGMDSALTQANNGMEVLWKALEARGYDMKKLIGDTDSEYTGSAKSVAGATSEEINNVAAIGNTLMYYVSPIPRIDENLARVVALMEGRTAALPMASGVTSGAVDYTDLFNTANQHLSSLPRMEQHLAEIHTMLGRALKTKGATTGFNTFLNS